MLGRLIVEKRMLISPVWDHILLGAIIAGAFFIRTQAILLLITLAITQCLSLFLRLREGDSLNGGCSAAFRRLLSARGLLLKGVLINLLPYATFFCAALSWEALMPQAEAKHLSILSTVSMNVITDNLNYYIELPSEFFYGVPHRHLFYFASIPIAITGIMKRYRTDFHMILYIILTFALYISLPFTQGLRYLLPLLPLYYSFVMTGMEAFQGGTTSTEPKLRTGICLFPVLFVLTWFAISSTSTASANMTRNRETLSGPYSKESQSMFSFITSSTEKESIIVFFKPRLMRMMTNRKSLMLRTKEELSRGDYVCLFTAQTGDQLETRCHWRQWRIYYSGKPLLLSTNRAGSKCTN